MSSAQTPSGIRRQPRKLPWLQRQEEHRLLTFLGRFSRPASGILLDDSEEERKAGTRGFQLKLWERAGNNVYSEWKRGRLCYSTNLCWGCCDQIWALEGTIDGERTMGLLTKTPLSRGICQGEPSESSFSRAVCLHFTDEETKAQRGSSCSGLPWEQSPPSVPAPPPPLLLHYCASLLLRPSRCSSPVRRSCGLHPGRPWAWCGGPMWWLLWELGYRKGRGAVHSHPARQGQDELRPFQSGGITPQLGWLR